MSSQEDNESPRPPAPPLSDLKRSRLAESGRSLLYSSVGDEEERVEQEIQNLAHLDRVDLGKTLFLDASTSGVDAAVDRAQHRHALKRKDKDPSFRDYKRHEAGSIGNADDDDLARGLSMFGEVFDRTDTSPTNLVDDDDALAMDALGTLGDAGSSGYAAPGPRSTTATAPPPPPPAMFSQDSLDNLNSIFRLSSGGLDEIKDISLALDDPADPLSTPPSPAGAHIGGSFAEVRDRTNSSSHVDLLAYTRDFSFRHQPLAPQGGYSSSSSYHQTLYGSAAAASSSAAAPAYRYSTTESRAVANPPFASSSSSTSSSFPKASGGMDPKHTQHKKPRHWTQEEDDLLRAAVARHGPHRWKLLAESVPGRTHTQCLQRWKKVLQPGLKKGPWSDEEDRLLLSLVDKNTSARGDIDWTAVASGVEGRTVRQVRERWRANLDPNVSKGVWSEEEDNLILAYQAQYGNKWAFIARHLEGRTEHSVKTRFRSIQRARRREWSAKEDKALLEMYSQTGGDWDRVASQFQTRTKQMLMDRHAQLVAEQRRFQGRE